jgi:hypothetical protein
MFAVYYLRHVPANIEARGFSLVDGSGNVLARLARTPDGAVLVLESNNGSKKVIIGMVRDEAALALVVEDQIRLDLAVEKAGAPSINLRDSRGRLRLLTGVDHDDFPVLAAWDETARLRLAVSPGRPTELQVSGADGAPLLSVPQEHQGAGAR